MTFELQQVNMNNCSEDGNFYENQLAELMDLRQAVRLFFFVAITININMITLNIITKNNHHDHQPYDPSNSINTTLTIIVIIKIKQILKTR